MIPKMQIDNDISYAEDVQEVAATKTYRLDYETGRIVGYIDELEALQQAVNCILNAERYAHVVYSWDYGAEIEKYIGEDYGYIVNDFKRSITDSLMQDDRIISVGNFEFNESGLDGMKISFVVYTIYGQFEQDFVL